MLISELTFPHLLAEREARLARELERRRLVLERQHGDLARWRRRQWRPGLHRPDRTQPLGARAVPLPRDQAPAFPTRTLAHSRGFERADAASRRRGGRSSRGGRLHDVAHTEP